ncbi:MAG: rhomboid family intramembrane serine protease [Gemmatimonadota bacterium]
MAARLRFRGSGGGYGGTSFGAAGFDFSLTPWVKRLLVANTAVFLLVAVGLLPFRWTVSALGFSPADLLRHPWSPLTYMFVHAGFWHLFFNMVGVFFFGPPLERAWGGSFFIRYYGVSGLGGALFSILLIPVIGSQPVVVGASGALYGLLLAFALRWPEAPIYIWGILPIRAKWFVTLFGFMALWGTLSGAGGGVAHWAHLGGLLTGYVYLRHGDRIRRGLERLLFKEKAPTRPFEVHRGGRSGRGGRARRRRRVNGDTLDRVDAILDKIREHGMDSLTDEERRFLDEVSRRYQET